MSRRDHPPCVTCRVALASRVCDRCAVETPASPSPYPEGWIQLDTARLGKSDRPPGGPRDLCSDCVRALDLFIGRGS